MTATIPMTAQQVENSFNEHLALHGITHMQVANVDVIDDTRVGVRTMCQNGKPSAIFIVDRLTGGFLDIDLLH